MITDLVQSARQLAAGVLLTHLHCRSVRQYVQCCWRGSEMTQQAHDGLQQLRVLLLPLLLLREKVQAACMLLLGRQ